MLTVPHFTCTQEVSQPYQPLEIVQIKTGNYRPRTAVWNLQADAEALLLMQTLNLKEPPKYTWQFADKDGNRKKFDFAKVTAFGLKLYINSNDG